MKPIGLLLIMVALPQCTVGGTASEAPEQRVEQSAATAEAEAEAEAEAARLARRQRLLGTLQARTITRSPEDEQRYQRARELAISRGRDRHVQLTNQLGLAADARDKVLAELESELQARTQIVDYLRKNPGMRSADLVARSQEPGNSHLADLIRRANPKQTQSGIRDILGEEGVSRLSTLRQAGSAALATSGANQTATQGTSEVTND